MSSDEDQLEHQARVALILEQNVSVVSAALRGEEGAASSLSALLSARTAAEAIEQATRLIVDKARATGSTWQEIGELLAITRQAAQQRFGQVTAPSEHGPLVSRAAEVIRQVNESAWQDVTADWDEVMRRELGAERLQEAWQQIIASAGPLQAIGEASVSRKGPYRIADVPLIFEHGPMKARVVFNYAAKISGLFVLLPDAP
jgi:hypothetical protein